MFYTNDALSDFERHSREQEEALKKLPICAECGEPIQDDYLWEINDEYICEECLNRNYRKAVEDVIE